MSLTDKVKSAAKNLKNLNLIDVVSPLPETQNELSEYIRKRASKHTGGNWTPEYDSKLKQIVEDVHKDYATYLNGGANTVDKLSNLVGLYGDANLAVGNVLGAGVFKLGSAGVKIVNHLYQALKGAVGYGYFAKNPKDYLYLPWMLLTDAISAVPFGTAASPTFKRMVKNRMATEVERRFLKEIKQYQPVHEQIKDKYQTPVKDRSNRIFRPDYKPIGIPNPDDKIIRIPEYGMKQPYQHKKAA